MSLVQGGGGARGLGAYPRWGLGAGSEGGVWVRGRGLGRGPAAKPRLRLRGQAPGTF